MSSIHITRSKEDPFARVPKELLDDEKISWAAKGVLAYLLGKKDGWVIRVADLAKRGSTSEYVIRKLLDELKTSGYARFVRLTGSDNRLRGSRWEVSDTPNLHRNDDSSEPEDFGARGSDTLSKTDLCTKNDPPLAPQGVLLEVPKVRRVRPEVMGRIGALFKRRATTTWDDRELKLIRKLEPIPEDDLTLIERYYRRNIPESSDIRRRDMVTLLANWNGELDRARRQTENRGY